MFFQSAANNRMNHWLKLSLIIAFLTASMTPLFRLQITDQSLIEEGIDYLQEKWFSDKWEIISDAAEKVKSSLFNENQPEPVSDGDYYWYMLTYGLGYGINAIGATDKFLHDVTFSVYNEVTLLGVGIFFLILIQFLLLFIRRFRLYLPFVSLCQILLAVLLFGFTLQDESTVIYLPGLLIFILIHALLIYVLRDKEV